MLKDRLRARSLPTSGLKAALVARLEQGAAADEEEVAQEHKSRKTSSCKTTAGWRSKVEERSRTQKERW